MGVLSTKGNTGAQYLPFDPQGCNSLPDGQLFQGSDGNFYGTSSRGGIGGGIDPKGGYDGNGAVYRITPTGTETVLHLFAGPPADGLNPAVLIQGSDGTFYGTTSGGGAIAVGAGTVFVLKPGGGDTILHSFAGVADRGGSLPTAGLVQGTDANLYGTAQLPDQGVMFKLTPEGTLTILHTFVGSPGDGAYPWGDLLQASDGNIYGVTTFGGSGESGTVYRITPAGVETILHSFSGPDGQEPAAGLMQTSDGNFYGTTEGGGAHKVGTIFKLTPEGVETVLYSFTGSTADGGYPLAALLQGADGNFYGTTTSGGMNHNGTIFQLTPAGALTTLYSFSGKLTQLADPLTNLVQGSDGNLYGTTSNGGAHDMGSFFRLTLN